MSGVAGGNRINKQYVKQTFEDFIDQVLKKIPGFTKASLSGSIKVGIKPDYGDIDCIALFEGDDKKEVKQRIIDSVTKLPQDIIMPFKSEKYKGKRYYNSGEIVSVLFPITGDPGKTIQVDIIVSLSETEHVFKNSFLDISAEKQGLLLGMAKAILIEESPQKVFQRLKISNVPPLAEDEEYEFNLSSVKLTLRKVKLKDFKEIAREDIWSSPDWSDVRALFVNYNIDGSFEELLQDLSRKLKSQRSKNRVAGTFRSMVSVKSGEVGTPKGDAKEAALKEVAKTLNESLEGEHGTVALYAGGFKPPHKAHFVNAQLLSKQADKLIIFIGPKLREGAITVTPEQSKTIWEIYAKYLPSLVEVRLSPSNPIRDTYDWVDANQERVEKVITGTTQEEMKKFVYFEKNKDKYPKVDVQVFPVIPSDQEEQEFEKFSASNLRSSKAAIQNTSWMPPISEEDKEKIVTILTAKVESFRNYFKKSYLI
jgi:nicotinamide mononucleotide adenylyltransferase